MPDQKKFVIGATALYSLIFVTLYPLFGTSVIVLSIIPVGLIGWFCGTRMGLAGGMAVLLIDTVMLNLMGQAGFFIVFNVSGIPNLLALFFVAGLTGTIHHLQQQYREELSRRKETEQRLQEREELYRKLFNSSFEAIAIHRRGLMLDVNHLFEVQFQAHRKEIIGLDAIRFAAPESHDLILDNIRNQYEEPFEAVGLRSDGTRFIMEMQTKLINYQGKAALFTALRDVTERKQAHETSLKLERMQLLKDVISNISHDLRTPLTIIGNYLYILQHNSDPQKLDKAVKHISDQSRHLNRLVESLISMSRLDEDADVELEPVEINDLIKLVMNHFHFVARDANVDINFESLPEPVWVTGAEPELYRAITNLIENAIHHSPEGGVVTVKLEMSDDNVLISVTDEGPGIVSEHLPYIFERFYRVDSARSTKDGRAGMGLAIVQRVAERHQGTITVETEVGKGSTFRLCLPHNITPTAQDSNQPEMPVIK